MVNVAHKLFTNSLICGNINIQIDELKDNLWQNMDIYCSDERGNKL